jgi:hypothetical protein
MARSSIREELKRRLRDHLALAETHPPEECPLDVRSVATALRISPTTLYKYAFNREINAAEQRQRENMWLSGAAIEQQFYTDRTRDLTAELQEERQRSKSLIARIAIMEANAARLGFDPEELYKPLLKPLRAVSRAGSGGKWHRRMQPRLI